MAQTTTLVKCPVCSRSFVNWTINQHIEDCLLRSSVEKEANQNIASSVNKFSESSELAQSRRNMKSSSFVAGIKKLSKSPESVDSRKNMKSSSFVAGKKLSKSPESVDSRKNKSACSFTSPPLKRAKMENSQTTSVLKQNGQQYQTTAKQNPQQETNGPKAKRDKFVPLAEKLRPRTLEEYVGQTQILGDKSMLKKLLEADEIPSMIFWGPPGCGKVFYMCIYLCSFGNVEGGRAACPWVPWNMIERGRQMVCCIALSIACVAALGGEGSGPLPFSHSPLPLAPLCRLHLV